MATTPVYAFPYPTTTDQPHGPNQMQSLALAVEGKFVSVDSQLNSGIATSDTQNTLGTTTSNLYTATLSGGTACGIAFIAPPSGKIYITNTIEAANSGAFAAACTIRVRTGSTIGSGSDVLAADDNEVASVTGTNFVTACRRRLLTGLTPGSSYNVQQLFRVTSGTGSYLRKHLIVEPTL